MAQPRDYTRQYNFNDYQTTNPSDPLPGSEVDGELNAVKLTLDDLNENIGLIQRDDGKLANQAVHKDAFDAGALALVNADSFNPRGDWVTARDYAVNDLVDFNGATYLATEVHTSSAAFGTDLDADKWILLANAAIATTASAVDKFEGDGAQTVFSLQYTYAADTSVLVFVNGALRNPGDDYSISGNQVTFVTAPSVPSVAGNENVIVWGASVVAQAAKEAAEAAESNASGFADEAEAWASKTTGQVEATDYSSKAYAIGGTGVDAGDGSAKDWAIKTSGTVGNTTEYSAKYWATSTDVVTVSTNIGDVTTVAGEITPTNNLATVATDIANVNTVGADLSGSDTIGTVAGSIANVNKVAAVDTQVTNLATIQTEIVNVNGIRTDVTTVAGIQAAVTGVNGISTQVTDVYNIRTDVSAVAAIDTAVTNVNNNSTNINTLATDLAGSNTIGAVALSIGNVNIVAGNNTNVTNVGSNIADVQTVAAEITSNNLQTVAADIQAVVDVANDLNEVSSEIDTVAQSIGNVDLVGQSIGNVNQVATNLADVNNFADTYFIGATAPASPTTGDLWFDTANSTMKVYDGNGFVNAGSSVSGVANSVEYTATAGQTSFNATYDAGAVDVYLNGVLLAATDYTATNGSQVVLATGAAAGDTVYIQSFGTFQLADMVSAQNGGTFNADITVNGDVTATAFYGDGSNLSGVDALPTQTGNAGYFLSTDGTNASWAQTGASAGMFWENDQTLTSSYTISSSKNALSAGPVSLATGVTVTIPSGSNWTIV